MDFRAFSADFQGYFGKLKTISEGFRDVSVAFLGRFRVSQ